MKKILDYGTVLMWKGYPHQLMQQTESLPSMDSAINVVFAVETTSLANYINLSVYLQAVSGLLKASKICVHTESYYMPNNTECRIIVILVTKSLKVK